MKDAEKAVERIKCAIENEELIVNYTDYDADGWGAGVIFKTLIERIGGRVETFHNTRSMGFGISKEGIDMILKKYPNVGLIVTTDNGIVAFEQVEYLNSLGIDTIITDHHEPADDGTVPNAYAVIDPKQKDCPYPFKELCGAGLYLNY